MIRGGSILMASGVSLVAIGVAVEDFLSGTILGDSINARWLVSEVLFLAGGGILFLAGAILSATGLFRRRKLAVYGRDQGDAGRSAILGRGCSPLEEVGVYPPIDTNDALFYFAGAIVVFIMLALSGAAWFGG
ncbi:hypothetical protein TPR58_17910 [Sphingomonas sp. HF-S3]|uniref:Uncharacterized protein n=1 Tax=Sphingomonas rustica TaxID=3103142 RepID=A0ABV0BBZ2_9SPHN